MYGVDLIDQRTGSYHLDRKPTIPFYLHIFYHLIDITCATSYIVYNTMNPNGNKLLNLKPLFQSTWLEDAQVETEHHQMAKQVPKESISISLSKVKYHQIFQSFKIFGNDVNVATKKKLEFPYVSSKRGTVRKSIILKKRA